MHEIRELMKATEARVEAALLREREEFEVQLKSMKQNLEAQRPLDPAGRLSVVTRVALAGKHEEHQDDGERADGGRHARVRTPQRSGTSRVAQGMHAGPHPTRPPSCARES